VSIPINLADPDFEPSDEDSQGLSTRAFADVAEIHLRQLARLRRDIAAERERVLESVRRLSGTAGLRLSEAGAPGDRRAQRRGYSVPIEKIVSRYVRSMANLSAAIELSDRVYVYDSSVDDVEARLCVRSEDGAVRKIYGDLLDRVTDATRGLARHAQIVDLCVA
jgi:hypothetical protein